MDGIDKLWNDLNELDGESVANRLGVRYEYGEYLVPFLDRAYRVSPASQEIEPSASLSDEETISPVSAVTTHLVLSLLSFLVSGELRPQEKVWVTEKELPGGSVFFQGPHGMPAEPLIERFGQSAESFVVRGTSLGGVQAEYGDGSIELSVLPGIRICLAIWEGDDEFPAACTFMFDRSFKGMFKLDVVFAIAASVVDAMVKKLT